MVYECVSSRFLFFNGQKRFTVEYAYTLNKWYVFKDDKTSEALWSKEIQPPKSKSPNREEAANILYEYLNEKQIK